MPEPRSILFLCAGNICRSPMAEGIARVRLREQGLDVVLDSAGTHDLHRGEPPDPRARAVARRHGTPIDDLRARMIRDEDFDRFDLILAADAQNIADLRRYTRSLRFAEVALLPAWCGELGCSAIPDPYYHDEAAFERVYALLQRCMDGLLDRLAKPA